MSFKATNKSGTKEVFEQRALYSAYAFEYDGTPNIFPASTKNFWFVENLLYGRVNTVSSAISAKKKYMERVNAPRTNRPIYVLDFVADAFRDLQREFQLKIKKGEISPDSEFFSDQNVGIVPAQGYSDFEVRFDKHHSKIYNNFIKFFINPKRKKEIQSFDTFISIYLEFLLEYSKNIPYTKSAFATSRLNSPLDSGLCIEIANLDHSKDEDKYDKFMSDPGFGCYRVEASKRGFLIDKNAPWRLIADVGSPEMMEYVIGRKSWATDLEALLGTYFNVAYFDEFELFKSKLTIAYNVYARANTNNRYDEIVNGEIKSRKVVLDTATPEWISSNYGDDFWLRQFILIKNEESKLRYSKQTAEQIIKKAIDLYFLVDTERGLRYIDDRFKGYSNLGGSTAHEKRKLELKETPDLVPDIIKELRAAFKKSKFLVY